MATIKAPTKRVKKELVYIIVDRDHDDGQEDIVGVYMTLPLAKKKLKELQKKLGDRFHYYYGPHIDSYEQNGGMVDCCIDKEDTIKNIV